MPIYAPKDYEDVIARIQKKVAAKNIKMGECLTDKEIEAFEKTATFRCHRDIVCF